MMETRKQVIELNIEDVLPNRFQPRIKFNEDAINELSKSIKEHGVIQPIVVRPIGDKFEIIAGERRYKASRMAGKTTIPAIITDLNDKDSAEVALIENVQRENLTPIEEAISYKKILDMGYITQDALATKLGKTQSTVANKLRLLNLEDDVQEALLNEKISERHARSLLKLTNKEQQKQMLNRIINERLTVRRADEEIEKMLNGNNNNFEQKQEIRYETNTQSINNNQPTPIQDNTFKFIESSKQPQQEEDLPIKKFFNIPQNNDTFEGNNQNENNNSQRIDEPTNDNNIDELKPKKFFNLMDEVENKTQPQQTEENPTFDFNKMFINPTNSTENSLLEEIHEIENSINNSNSLPPLDEPQNKKEEEQKNDEPVKNPVYDDFDDDMEFIEEEPSIENYQQETINENISIPGIHNEEPKIDGFKGVLEEIRNCSKRIEESGFEIETEEIDLDGTYQVIFKIKNNG